MTTLIRNNFIPLSNDILFKDIFSNPNNHAFLEDLLECHLGLEKGSLSHKLKVKKEATLNKFHYLDKNIRGDLIITTNNLIINIEMHSFFNDIAYTKSEYYIMRIYSTELKRGMNYNQITKVTQINFINETNIKISEEIKSSIVIGKNANMDFVRLDKARQLTYTNNRYIKWLKFIGAQTKEERDKVAKGDELLMQLAKVIDDFYEETKDDETFTRDYWLKHIYNAKGELEASKHIAKNMLQKGMNISLISEVTGLTIADINTLNQEK